MITGDDVKRASYAAFGETNSVFDDDAIDEIQRISRIMWASVPKGWKLMRMGIIIGMRIAERKYGRGTTKV